MIMLKDVDEFKMFNNDSHYKAKPMNFHLCSFRGFLLYYNHKCRELSTTLGNNNVLDVTGTELFDYCSSPDLHDDPETGLSCLKKIGASAQAKHGELTA
jgi:hypothetical protein